jgi:hypothetical protein
MNPVSVGRNVETMDEHWFALKGLFIRPPYGYTGAVTRVGELGKIGPGDQTQIVLKTVRVWD